jgi:acetyltransferase-like isoleucine patch superfamily enzyme
MLNSLKLTYHMARNVRRALINAILGESYAEFRRLQRAGRITVGARTYGYPAIWTDVHSIECLRVGKYSSLGGKYLLGGKHGDGFVTTYPHRINFKMEGAGTDGFPTVTGDTIVGSDVWTCENCLILSGVTIGDGAIVAAGAVVTKDVPPYAIVGGNPAKLIRYRFDEDQIQALLEIRWWDWPEEKIREAVPLLASRDVDRFIAYAREQAPAPGVATAR